MFLVTRFVCSPGLYPNHSDKRRVGERKKEGQVCLTQQKVLVGTLTRWRWDDTSQIARFPLESKVKMLDKWACGTTTVCSHTRIQGEVNVM